MSAATEERVEVDVDLEKIVECCWDGCSNEAEWGGRHGCCNRGGQICDPCKKIFEKHLRERKAWALMTRLGLHCSNCGMSPYRDPIWWRL